MAQDINLLPVDLKTGKDALKASRALTRVAMILGGFLLVSLLVGGGVLLFLYQNLNNSRQREEQLKNQVQSLEGTEQKLVLIKDRIQKAQGVLALRDTFDTVKRYDEIVAALPADSTVTRLEIDRDTSRITVLAKTSDDLSTILKSLNNPKYTRVEVESLTFNVFSGYELIVAVN